MIFTDLRALDSTGCAQPGKSSLGLKLGQLLKQ